MDISNTNPATLRQQLVIVASKLTAKERDIITARFGLDGDEPMTLEAISSKFNIDVESARQIEAKTLRKARHPNNTLRVV